MKTAKTLWIKRTDILNKCTADILTFFLISASGKRHKQTGTQSRGTGRVAVTVTLGRNHSLYNTLNGWQFFWAIWLTIKFFWLKWMDIPFISGSNRWEIKFLWLTYCNIDYIFWSNTWGLQEFQSYLILWVGVCDGNATSTTALGACLLVSFSTCRNKEESQKISAVHLFKMSVLFIHNVFAVFIGNIFKMYSYFQHELHWSPIGNIFVI